MEGFKGTPGPWRFSTQFGAVTVSKPGILEGDKTICDINYNVPTERVPEMDANAALITVAPELLEALMEIIKYHSKIPTGFIEGHLLGGTIPFQKGKQAITKALGLTTPWKP